MMVTISPSSDPSLPSSLLSPAIDPEDNIVLKPINVAESNDKMSSHPRFWCGPHENGSENTKDVYNYGVPSSDKSKTPMCQIAELARFHKLKHEYQLMDESGPAHKKLFTVQLVLDPHQIFEGSGASIKKAQQSAAAEALRLTTLSKPPEKNLKKQKRGGDPSSACVLLSHVCRRLKMVEPVYTMNSFYPPRAPAGCPAPPMPLMHSHFAQQLQQPQLDFMAYNVPLTPKSIVCPGPPNASYPGSPMDASPLGSGYLLPGGGLRPNRNTLPTIQTPTHMCTIVMASHPPVHAIAGNKQEARNNAATQALCLLGPALAMLEQKMKEEKEAKKKGANVDTNKENVNEVPVNESVGTFEDTEATVPNESPSETPVQAVEGGRVRRTKTKSVISQVHECALQMKLTVEFEVVSEEGRAHDRSYVVECRLLGGETVLQARGSGRQKREAKQAACAELIDTMKKMESSPIHIATVLYKSQRKAALPAPREPKRKTIVKHMKMDPSYGHQINPVSRLIQVLQARGEEDPKFQNLGEQGQFKYKQFNYQVEVGDLFAQGSGPNKRLAKRAAAELMLELMGVAKRMPEPGKSLLKRREDDSSCGGAMMMSIGVFNPADLLEPPVAPPVEVKEEKKAKKKGGIMWAEEDKEEDDEDESRKEPRRRVTFNAQVAACTAPDDQAYPMTEVAPLKADDLGCAGKARRRGREGRIRSLNDTQKMALGSAVVAWIEGREEIEEDNVFRIEALTAPKPERTPAKLKLDKLGTQFGFNPHYTIFPQGESANATPPPPARVASPAPSSSSIGDQSMITTGAAFFVIVNLPLSKAIMGEGHGETIDDAHEAAAADALRKIGTDTDYVPGLNNVPPPQSKSQFTERPVATNPNNNSNNSQSLVRPMHNMPNPYYNANFAGFPPGSPTTTRSMQHTQQQQQPHVSSPVHKEYPQQTQHNGGAYSSFPGQSSYELPTMADFYGQFDSTFSLGTGGGGGGSPSHSSQRSLPPPSSHHYPYSNGVSR